MKHNTISFYDNFIVSNINQNNHHHHNFIRTTKTISIPPNMETIFTASSSKPLNHNNTYIIEPRSRSSKHKFLIARIIVNPSSRNNVPCRVINISNQTIRITPHYKIATIEKIEINNNNNKNDNHNNNNNNNNNNNKNNNNKMRVGPHSNNNNSCSNKSTTNQQHNNYNISTIKTTDDVLNDLKINIEQSSHSDSDYNLLKQCIANNRDIFAKSLSELSCSNLVYHTIDTNENRPIRKRVYPTSPENKAEISKQCNEFIKLGFIKESTSPWSASVLLVNKKDGTKRFVVDYRHLNKVTKQLFYPLPTFDDVVESLSNTKPNIFSVLDLRSGFYQLPLDPKTAHKSAFSTHDGHYEFTRLPQGLANSPFSFQLLTQSVLKHLTNVTCLVYVDDIICYSRGMKDHVKHLNEIFDRFRDANLKLHPTKCQFAKNKVLYLGYYITDNGLETDPSKIKIIKDYPKPTNLKSLRSFIGLAQFYRRFIKDFSKIATPLYDLQKKDKEFIWSDDCQNAFQKLKQSLMQTPTLKYPDTTKPFILNTDASTTAISYILQQRDSNNIIRPIAFGGRTLKQAEKNWTVTELECLAVLEGCKAYTICQTTNSQLSQITSHSNTSTI